ncbi:MAG TPA: hypothetical protein PKK12_02410 [Candidatus Aminicenantes bacterium]|nr:hypothetical protein [Candidatus Aminicenantes bacterium]
MSELTVTLSKKDLELLVKHVALARWMLTSNEEEPDKKLTAFSSKILGIAKKNGFGDGIEYDEKAKEYFLTEEKEDEYQQHIDEYDEGVFWAMLGDVLSERDCLEKHGEEKLGKMDEEKRWDLIDQEQEKYEEEFEKHGVLRLRIVK